MVGERLEVGETLHHTAIGGGTRQQMSIVYFFGPFVGLATRVVGDLWQRILQLGIRCMQSAQQGNPWPLYPTHTHRISSLAEAECSKACGAR